VHEAKDNDYLQKGLVLIAPADKHMRLIRRGSKLMVECFVGQKLHGVMPAADILFESVAPLMRNNVIGVILTGMGADGARGMLLLHNAGAKTIGQDKASSVVYGMPKIAADLGALDIQLPLDRIADAIVRSL
jgi:two-component system chemotaxis response regulator CheB